MNYITVAQLSERWQVTPRYIQNLCRDGRLPGAAKLGKLWIIPEDIKRPADYRYKSAARVEKLVVSPNEICWSVMGAVYRIPGTANETIRSLVDYPDAAMLTEAQFAYLHGDIDVAGELTQKLFHSTKDFEIKIGAAFIMGICAMYDGDDEGWQNARTLIEKLPCPDSGYLARKELWLAVYGASIYDMSAYPEWFRRGCFDSLPHGYYPAACVHYIKYIYLLGDSVVKEQPFADVSFRNYLFVLPLACEPLISQMAAEKAIISEIYLRLICASSYHHAGEDDLAVRHIEHALILALPDRIYAPFAEQRLNLDSLIDDCMKKINAEAFDEMKALHARMMNGWSAVHNAVLHRRHTTRLTARELEAARLAVFGLSNEEISIRMGLSINSVKRYLQAAMDKTGTKKRTDLAAFI